MNYNNQDQSSLYNDDANDNYLNNYTTIQPKIPTVSNFQPQIPTVSNFQPQISMSTNTNTTEKLKLLDNFIITPSCLPPIVETECVTLFLNSNGA